MTQADQHAQTQVPSPPRPARSPVSGQPRRPAPAPGPRSAYLLVRRVEPASVLLMAVVAAVGFVVAAVVLVTLLYALLDVLGVFDTLGRFSQDIGASSTGAVLPLRTILAWTALVSTSLAAVGVALATGIAFVYNLVSGLVGGPEVTLADRPAARR